MHLRHSFKIAYRAIKINKSRSFLTILGILIGIAAIMMMVSLGSGAEELILGEISGFGGETIAVNAGQEPSGPTDFASALYSDSLKEKDVELLRRRSNVPYAKEVEPLVMVSGNVSYEGETYTPMILGGSAEFLTRTFNTPIREGGVFTESEIQQRAKVAVIGDKVRQELFGESDVLGKNVQIGDFKFRIVGILAKKGMVSFFNMDELVIIPHTTAQTYILGIDYYHEIDVVAESIDVVDQTAADIEMTLREAHGIDDPDKDDFYVTTTQGAIEQIQTVISTLTAFLSSVVAIALVVGGVGVMNIMLVSVTERTHEIGLRKAIGATEKEILQQFLLEAVLLTSIGGLIGIILGGTLSFLISLVMAQFVAPNWSFSFPFSAILLGMGVTSLVGLVFGLYPARKAARKSPIEALSYE
ncbi:MAG: ABC transporter permease [Candidatus Colwellbacteria bacterium]|nr:ABC transporter permease [Candidatus Colwellbacteria bacterium]